jgi:hypothetical protein
VLTLEVTSGSTLAAVFMALLRVIPIIAWFTLLLGTLLVMMTLTVRACLCKSALKTSRQARTYITRQAGLLTPQRLSVCGIKSLDHLVAWG